MSKKTTTPTQTPKERYQALLKRREELMKEVEKTFSIKKTTTKK